MNNINLSLEQKEIVEDFLNKKGALLIQACAGSGKTAILTEIVRNLLEEAHQQKYRILSLTFTNKSAGEMQQRLEKEKYIQDRVFIGTIHKFALEVIHSYRNEIGYKKMPHIIDKESDKREIIREVFLENIYLNNIFKNTNEHDQKELLDSFISFISEQKKNLIFIDNEINQYEDWSYEILSLFKDYNQILKNQNLIDYDDILLLAWKILTEKQHISEIYQRLYRYILVDEAQDLSKAQYYFIKALAGKNIKNILMVGDKNQSINQFAGANEEYMSKYFINDFDARTKELKFNYRSSKEIIKIANRLKENSHFNLDNNYFLGKTEIKNFENEDEEARFIIKEINSLLKNGYKENYKDKIDINLEQIGIIARNKFVFRRLEELLKEDDYLKNKYYLKQNNTILNLESDLIKIFELGTRILTNKQADVYINQIINILQINNYEPLKDKNELEILKNICSLEQNILKKEYCEILQKGWNFLYEKRDKFYSCVEELKAKVATLEKDDNERQKIEGDINLLKELWREYSKTVKDTNISVENFRRHIAMGAFHYDSAKSLTLSTVHSSKGLEFEVVFLIGMNQGTFPDYRSMEGKAFEQEKNNFYVAITRAKKILYISYPIYKKFSWGSKIQEKSEFLENLL